MQLVGHVDEQAEAREARQHFTDEIDLLGGKHFCEVCKPSHIAARMGEAGHQSECHRVRASGHDNWDRARCLSRREVGRKRRGNDHAWIEANQLHRQIWQTVKITICEPKLEAHVAALDISEPPHALSKACQIAFQRLRGSGAQNADERRHPLLRARRERPRRRRTADERYELAALHSNTSSAKPVSGRGTGSPSALAVLRLRTSAYLTARWIGRSLGFSPLRIRST